MHQMNLENYPLLVFEYPNNKYGIYIFKNGYISTHKIFKQRILIRKTNFKLNKHNNKKILLVPIRNPVERFESGINTFYNYKKSCKYSVDQLIEWKAKNIFINPHFFNVSKILKNAKLCFDQIYLYSFPNHYEQMLNDGGYNGDLLHENIGKRKIVLTESQKEKVRDIYAKDIEIFKSIQTPGQLYDPHSIQPIAKTQKTD